MSFRQRGLDIGFFFTKIKVVLWKVGSIFEEGDAVFFEPAIPRILSPPQRPP